MTDHPNPAEVLRKRTPGIALLLMALVTGLLLWEAMSPQVLPPRTTAGRQSSVRRIPGSAARVESRPAPGPVVAPTPPPPLSPAPALHPTPAVDHTPPVNPTPAVDPTPSVDPTPPVDHTPPVDPTTLRVSDIVIDPMDPSVRFAVIDGVAIRAGETIGGHRVQKVLPDRVLIGEEGTIVLLPSKEER